MDDWEAIAARAREMPPREWRVDWGLMLIAACLAGVFALGLIAG